jgi:hypothetical protein
VTTREIQVQRLLGRKARDVDGRVAGRVEELVVKKDGDEYVVLEFHLGPAAAFERIAAVAGQLPLLKHIPLGARVVCRVRWDQMDLTDLEHPRVTVRRDELQRKSPESGLDSQPRTSR